MSGSSRGVLNTVLLLLAVLIAGALLGSRFIGGTKTVVVTPSPDIGATVTAAVAQAQVRSGGGSQPGQVTPVTQVLTQPVTQAPVVQSQSQVSNVAQPTTAPAVQQPSSSNYSSVCSGTKGNSPYSDQTGPGGTAHWAFTVPTGATAFVWGGLVNNQSDGYKVFMENARVDVSVKDGAYCLVDKNSAEQAWNQLLAETAGNPHSTKPDCPSGWKCRGV